MLETVDFGMVYINVNAIEDCKDLLERYEALMEEILGLDGLNELAECYNETEIKAELTRAVQVRLDKLLKELKEI